MCVVVPYVSPRHTTKGISFFRINQLLASYVAMEQLLLRYQRLSGCVQRKLRTIIFLAIT
jgi:hypothetical protein